MKRSRIITHEEAAARVRRREPDERRFPANGKGFLFVPVLWFIWFLMIYAVQGAGCALGWDGPRFIGIDALRWVILLITVLELAVIVWFGARSYVAWRNVRERGTDDGGSHLDQSMFLAYAALLNAMLFGLASVWTAFALFAGDPCGV